jgi:hypothetical protein
MNIMSTSSVSEVQGDAESVAAFADRTLALAKAVLHEAYYYQSLSLCVIDSIFSINARYAAVENVVARYCKHFSLIRLRADRRQLPATAEQESVAVLCDRLSELGAERFAAEIFANRQRTSPRSGILKAEAVHRFAQVLGHHRVNYFQDIPSVADSTLFETAIRAIPGQASGISLQYFWMLAGSDDLVKPDRQIVRFVQRALGRPVAPQFAGVCLAEAAHLLQGKYPHLTPRLLDYEAWRFEKDQPS